MSFPIMKYLINSSNKLASKELESKKLSLRECFANYILTSCTTFIRLLSLFIRARGSFGVLSGYDHY